MNISVATNAVYPKNIMDSYPIPSPQPCHNCGCCPTCGYTNEIIYPTVTFPSEPIENDHVVIW